MYNDVLTQAETHYSYENVTDFRLCMALYNLTNSSFTCQDIKDYINKEGVNCTDATEYNKRLVDLGTREGMNILGIIVFTVAFAITLGRLGEEGQKLVRSIGVLNEAIMKLVTLVMW